MDIIFSIDKQDFRFLFDKVSEETKERGESSLYGFFAKDEKNNIIAGCYGSLVYGVIYIDQLWVHPDYRKQGFGKKLMEMAHAYGKERGCKKAVLQTMNFQRIPGFYEKLGYVVEFEQFGYCEGSCLIFYAKSL